ncbi:hypothetical protein SeMB42_g06117 [Synchytrium endobioticum]|uniref:Uncharacterized protein n=1 Tax=Synchytrium endobioticum TaxID=286115 RepID=A0A507CK56_9FUNG|nr:hypothetical protein SeMB42_g06117 [Synchytrium endobioticum]TPX45531.1 hypothetical protein SeLEV6574_g03818 [Synchytrium endobioticum]
MSTAAATRVSPELRLRSISLYRNLLRLHKAWPKQERRLIRADEAILKAIREAFAPLSPTPHGSSQTASSIEAAISEGETQLASLQNMLHNKIEAKFPLPPDSRIKTYLPSTKTFSLLDAEAQKELDRKEEGTFSFLKTYVSGKRERAAAVGGGHNSSAS